MEGGRRDRLSTFSACLKLDFSLIEAELYMYVCVYVYVCVHIYMYIYICACTSKIATIGSDIGLSPGRHQTIIWTNAGILLTGTLEQISVKS